MRKQRLIALLVALVVVTCIAAPGLASAPDASASYIRQENLKATPSGISLANFRRLVELPETATIQTSDGAEATDPIATGMVVRENADAVPRTVVVIGDVTGTGRISLTQLVRTAAAFKGIDPLEGAYLSAADFTGEGKLTLADLVQAADLFKNGEDIDPITPDHPATEPFAFDAATFAEPIRAYMPGVRWWWPGGCVEADKLKEQVDYLASHNFGYVEINPFYVESILEGDEDKVLSIYTPAFYDVLDEVVGYCEEKGITVDLNMGSGYCANSQDVTYEDSLGNMALGRTTITGAQADSITVPAAERSLFYTAPNPSRMVTYPREPVVGEWRDENVVLQGVLIGERTGTGTAFEDRESWNGATIPGYSEMYDADGNVSKTYETQIVLSKENSFFIPADDPQITDGTITLSDEIRNALDPEKEYEVAAMYYVPSGGQPFRAAPDWYVVDHLAPEKITQYLNDWLGNESLSAIVENHDNVRALFNDSYEFRSDVYYTPDTIKDAADAENNGLGYDFTPYLPTIYRQANVDFFDTPQADTYLTYTTDDNEKERITYDYNQLINTAFLEGMEAFESGCAERGLLYRQQAYNPPIDTLGAAAFVDIPETEQAAEMSLIRASSGAHLYDRPLITCEEYTLGCVPLTNSLEFVKAGYDVMATGGVNNFFYHGLNYPYGVDSETYGEIGWSPWPAIGINMSELNSLAPYWTEMNEYAARLNYLMQTGSISKDVAYYMPFNGSLSLTEPIVAMNTNGIAWDAINDESITAEDTTVVDGQISVNGGNMIFDALVVEGSTLPVATLQKIQKLAEDGANIIFYGGLPSKQPSYLDGAYAAEDAKAAAAAQAAVTAGATQCQDSAAFVTAIEEMVIPTVNYTANENVRFIRRTQPDGSELAFIRNLSNEHNTITIKVADTYDECYWLDQSTGEIYPAQRAEDGTITATFGASADQVSTSMTGTGENSMSLALLCLTSDSTLVPEDSITEGIPAAIDTADPASTVDVTISSLAVGDATYTGEVLGLWNSESFQNGALMSSDDIGTYTGTFNLESIPDSQRAYICLEGVNTAAEIEVNDTEAGSVMYAPFRVDVTDLLKEGDNTISIALTPRKYNKVHPDLTADELVDTGLVGPVSVAFYA